MLSARRPESTQSKVDAEWEAEKRGGDNFTPDFRFLLSHYVLNPFIHFSQNFIYDNRINRSYCTIVLTKEPSQLQPYFVI